MRPHGMARPPAGPDPDRDGWLRLGTELGRPNQEDSAGDVIWCPPGEKHWHGATASTAMTHIAILEHLEGKTVDWMEKVSDEQYRAASGAE
jgi:quercetin dioxygenase-like cupin family protein